MYRFRHDLKLFLFFFFFSLGLLISHSVMEKLYFTYDAEQVLMDHMLQDSLDKERHLQDFLAHSEQTLRTIQENRYFKEYVSGGVDQEFVKSLFLAIVSNQDRIMQLRYIDAEGRERIRVDRTEENTTANIVDDERLQQKAQRYYFQDSLTRPLSSVWYSALDLNVEHGKVEVPYVPTLRAIMTLPLDGEFGGILVINYFMKSFLDQLVTLGGYKSILADADGYTLVHYDPDKEWGAYKDEKYTVAQEFPKVSAKILSEPLYQHHRVIARHLDLPTANQLILISQLKKESIQEQSAKMYKYYLVSGLFALLFATLVSLVVARMMEHLGYDLEKSRELTYMFRMIFEYAGVGLAQYDLEGRWIKANRKLLNILGCSAKELQGRSPMEWTHPEDRETEQIYIDEMIEGSRSSYEIEKRMVSLDGEIVWVHLNASLLSDKEQRSDSVIIVVEDITKDIEYMKRLRQSTTVFDNTTEGVIITDDKVRIISVNKAFETLTGYSQKEVIGQDPSILSSGRHDDKFFERMWQTIHDVSSWSGEIWNRRKDGEVYPELLNISSVRDKDGHIENYVAVFSDITAMKASEERIHYLSTRDQLTALPNRRLLKSRLDHTLEISRRHDSKIAVLLVDIDNFKLINDTLGHPVGDQVLIEIVNRLRPLVRDEDSLARSGGDEFVIVTDEFTTVERLMPVVQKIVRSFASPIESIEQEFYVSVSIGISIYPDDGADSESLLKNADAAMHEAKNEGKHTFRFYDDKMTSDSFERVIIENALFTALEHKELELYYQPQQRLADGKYIGCEVLLRWDHPTMGLIMPERFIPVAEEAKLIIPIGEFVLNEACRSISIWKREGLHEGRFAVNVSGIQMEYSEFMETLRSSMARFDIEPHELEIEVTESIVMRDPVRWIGILNEIKTIGISISLDDFGTGYSSLAYLRRLPLDMLKIDKAFVNDLPDEKDARAIADTIIEMGRSLGMSTLAEGIETERQREYLAEKGCDYMQGYLFSKPIPRDAMHAWLLKHSGK